MPARRVAGIDGSHCADDMRAGPMALIRSKSALLLAVSLLAGCGDAKSSEDAPEASPSPTGYYILAKDGWLEHPEDICRQKNSEFVANLVGRVDRALRSSGLGRVESFDQFNAYANEHGRGAMQATIWVKAVYRGKADTTIVAVGDFNPATCAIGPMRAGIDDDAVIDPNRRTITVA